MNSAPESLSDSFETVLEHVRSEAKDSSGFRKKKLIFWGIRTFMVIVLYIMFWDQSWVRWSLLIYIPLNMLSLFAIYGTNFILERKIRRTRRKIKEAENQY